MMHALSSFRSVAIAASFMLGPNWDFFVEYDYLGFGNKTVEMTNPSAVPGTISVA